LRGPRPLLLLLLLLLLRLLLLLLGCHRRRHFVWRVSEGLMRNNAVAAPVRAAAIYFPWRCPARTFESTM
jgi:hypothetical protein